MHDIDYKSKIVFHGTVIKIGRFFCPDGSALWKTENIAGNSPMLVFPRTNVRIIQADRRPVVSSPNNIMYYNTDQLYYREQIGSQADACEYFHIKPNVIEEVYQSLGYGVPDNPNCPFGFSHAPSSARFFLLQRCLYRYFSTYNNEDGMELEETFLWFLADAVKKALAFNQFETPKRKSTQDLQIELVEAAKEALGLRFKEQIQLEDLAVEVGASVYHLCRIFRKHTGLTIQNFIQQLRLRYAVQNVIDDRQHSLTQIALDYGFSSHSHFTNAFRKLFGISPSRLRSANTSQSERNRIHRILNDAQIHALT